MFMLRQPFASGFFYPAERWELERELNDSFFGRNGPKNIKQKKMFGVVVPHGRMKASGNVAAWAYSTIPKSNYIIIGANHNHTGLDFAIMKEGLWKTPLGEIAVDTKMAEKIINKSELLEHDVTAHTREHSIEVQLPFLQHIFGSEFKIVPIAINNRSADRNFLDECSRIGKSVADAVRSSKEDWTIIATTDFSEGKKTTVQRDDKKILSSIKNLNSTKFFDHIHDNRCFICGYGALIAAMSATKNLGAKSAKTIKYSASSSETEADKTGYASLIIQ